MKSDTLERQCLFTGTKKIESLASALFPVSVFYDLAVWSTEIGYIIAAWMCLDPTIK